MDNVAAKTKPDITQPATGFLNTVKNLLKVQEFVILLVIIVLLVIGGVVNPRFLGIENIKIMTVTCNNIHCGQLYLLKNRRRPQKHVFLSWLTAKIRPTELSYFSCEGYVCDLGNISLVVVQSEIWG